MKVAVCIATYRRPVMLDALLDSLEALRFDAEARPDVLVVVVDNEDAASSREVVARRMESFPFPIRWAVEPRRNIALARNRCIQVALGNGADFVAFVDDDEQVAPDWLAALLRVRAASGADVVGGPVLNAYGRNTPPWIVAGSLPARTRMPTGTRIATAETANVLIAARLLQAMRQHFDPRFGVTGGSDSHFFLRASQAGAHMVWADEAVVHETVPDSRATGAWLLRRAFRVGNAGVHVASAALPVWRWLPRRLAAAAYRVARGLVQLPAAPFRGRAAVVGALQDLCLGAGAVAAVLGFRYVEYRRSHGA